MNEIAIEPSPISNAHKPPLSKRRHGDGALHHELLQLGQKVPRQIYWTMVLVISSHLDHQYQGIANTNVQLLRAHRFGVMVAIAAMSPKTISAYRPKESARLHQPGQDLFKATRPEDIEWKPFAAFPPSVRLAVVVGQPSNDGPYTIRVKVPGGVKLMSHRHPEDRVYTVITGIFYIGLGDQFDADSLKAYGPGSVIVLTGNTSHFHWAKSGEYITQVTAMGPLGLEYVNAEDDPRIG